MTDGTFADARNLCVHHHRVLHGPGACSSDDPRVRWYPSHAIEVTAAWLDQSVRETLGDDLARATPEQRRRLATVVHLCGRCRGASFVKHGFRQEPGERCGDHDLADYLARVTESHPRVRAPRRGGAERVIARGFQGRLTQFARGFVFPCEPWAAGLPSVVR